MNILVLIECTMLWLPTLVLTPHRPIHPDPQGCAYAALKQWEDAAVAFFEGSNLDPKNQDVSRAFQNAITEGRKEAAAKAKK